LSKPETQINAITGYYGTALNGAAADGLIPIIKMLLKAGANPFLGNTGFPCVLAAAIGEWDTETTIFLVESIENIFSRCYEVAYFPLAHAVIEGRKEIVKFLVKKGVDVNKSGGVWGSALQAAAYYRLDRKRGLERGLEIVDFLLKNGAEVNAKGGLFGNALQAAVASSHKKVVQLLQDNGALLDPPGAEWDALLVSIKEDYCKVIVMSDVEDAEKTRKRLDRFQRKHGMKPTPEAETETESEFEARLQWDSSSG
jgi:ankyrin repeat protein